MSEEGPIAREKTELSFRTIEADDAPERVQKWIEKNRNEETKKVFHADGKTYVVIMLGQKSTGGYAVKIDEMQLEKIVSPASKAGEGTVNVTYKVVEPQKGSVNIQVLTYPMAIAEIDGVRNYTFQFSQQAKGDGLKKSQNQSDGESEGVQPEELTSEGKITE